MNSTDLHWSKETVIHVFIDDKDIIAQKVIPIKGYAQEDKTVVVEFSLQINNWAFKEQVAFHSIELSLQSKHRLPEALDNHFGQSIEIKLEAYEREDEKYLKEVEIEDNKMFDERWIKKRLSDSGENHEE